MLNLPLTFFPCFSWLHCYSVYSDIIPFRPAFKLSQLTSYAHPTIIHIAWINLILVNFFQFFFCFRHIFLCLVVKVLDSQSRSPMFKNHWEASSLTQFHSFDVCKWISEISGNLVVKSKLPRGSGSSLYAVEPRPWEEAIKFFLFTILSDCSVQAILVLSLRENVSLWFLLISLLVHHQNSPIILPLI